MKTQTKPTDPLLAAFLTANQLPERDARARFSALLGRPPLVDEADELQFLAQRLGVGLVWSHNRLAGNGWEGGRNTQHTA